MVYYIEASGMYTALIHSSSDGRRFVAIPFRHLRAALIYVASSDRGKVLARVSRVHRSGNNSAFVSGVNIVRNLAEVGTQYANFP